MHRLFVALAVCFSCFIIWVIYLANTGQMVGWFKFFTQLPHGDKIGHFCIFGTLTLLANLSTKCRTWHWKKIHCYWGSSVVLLFVTVEELSQHFLPRRTLDIYDYLADLAGIGLASLISWLLVYFWPQLINHSVSHRR